MIAFILIFASAPFCSKCNLMVVPKLVASSSAQATMPIVNALRAGQFDQLAQMAQGPSAGLSPLRIMMEECPKCKASGAVVRVVTTKEDRHASSAIADAMMSRMPAEKQAAAVPANRIQEIFARRITNDQARMIEQVFVPGGGGVPGASARYQPQPFDPIQATPQAHHPQAPQQSRYEPQPWETPPAAAPHAAPLQHQGHGPAQQQPRAPQYPQQYPPTQQYPHPQQSPQTQQHPPHPQQYPPQAPLQYPPQAPLQYPPQAPSRFPQQAPPPGAQQVRPQQGSPQQGRPQQGRPQQGRPQQPGAAPTQPPLPQHPGGQAPRRPGQP